MRMNPEQLKALIESQKRHRRKIGPRRREPGKMNKNETEYSHYLNKLKVTGEILEWIFEPLKFRLADKTYLELDFIVVYPDRIAFHDTKGMKRKRNSSGERVEGFWAEEDAMVKIKAVAEKFWWFEVAIVWQLSDGTWAKRELI